MATTQYIEKWPELDQLSKDKNVRNRVGKWLVQLQKQLDAAARKRRSFTSVYDELFPSEASSNPMDLSYVLHYIVGSLEEEYDDDRDDDQELLPDPIVTNNRLIKSAEDVAAVKVDVALESLDDQLSEFIAASMELESDMFIHYRRSAHENAPIVDLDDNADSVPQQPVESEQVLTNLNTTIVHFNNSLDHQPLPDPVNATEEGETDDSGYEKLTSDENVDTDSENLRNSGKSGKDEKRWLNLNSALNRSQEVIAKLTRDLNDTWSHVKGVSVDMSKKVVKKLNSQVGKFSKKILKTAKKITEQFCKITATEQVLSLVFSPALMQLLIIFFFKC